MNLIDLFSRKDSTLVHGPGLRQTRWAWEGRNWRAMALPDGEALRLLHFAQTHPLWQRPDRIGWYAAARSGPATLRIAFQRGDTTLGSADIAIGDTPVPVPLPWPPVDVALDDTVELVLAALGGEVEILVQKMLSRDPLYARAVGTGVEIGPGPVPQIHNGDGVSVMYLEETPPEKWVELYDKGGKFDVAAEAFPNLVVGKAASVPVDDGSLDFIFSSHVFEHLANPLGHLAHWHTKMAPGGVVMAVVPELTSTKDRYMRPCTHDEFLDEYEAGIMEPQMRHYDRFVTRLTGGEPNPDRARKMRDIGESIHVHFYDRDNISRLLQEAVDRLGYRSFELIHTPNHKDFHFVLEA